MSRHDNRKQAAAALAAAAAGGAGAAAAHPTSFRQPSLAKHRSRQAPAHTPDRCAAALCSAPVCAASRSQPACKQVPRRPCVPHPPAAAAIVAAVHLPCPALGLSVRRLAGGCGTCPASRRVQPTSQSRSRSPSPPVSCLPDAACLPSLACMWCMISGRVCGASMLSRCAGASPEPRQGPAT